MAATRKIVQGCALLLALALGPATSKLSPKAVVGEERLVSQAVIRHADNIYPFVEYSLPFGMRVGAPQSVATVPAPKAMAALSSNIVSPANDIAAITLAVNDNEPGHPAAVAAAPTVSTQITVSTQLQQTAQIQPAAIQPPPAPAVTPATATPPAVTAPAQIAEAVITPKTAQAPETAASLLGIQVPVAQLRPVLQGPGGNPLPIAQLPIAQVPQPVEPPRPLFASAQPAETAKPVPVPPGAMRKAQPYDSGPASDRDKIAARQSEGVVRQLVGVASWYGPGFHGRSAADGSIFDQNELTAAHRTLPFNTRVRVTSMISHRSVIVRITDRGPYVDGREIDLSSAAARAIGISKRGTARVKLEVLGPPIESVKTARTDAVGDRDDPAAPRSTTVQ